MQHFLLVYLYVILSVSTYAQQFSQLDEHFIDSFMNANYKTGEPGAVIMIAKNGRTVFKKGYGLANLELNVSNKPDYVFRIGSMSKQFTAICVLKLAQDGKLNLQDDIRKYLPNYNTHGRDITIANLLSHTSGIRNINEVKNFPEIAVSNQSPHELLNYFMNDSLAFEPGTDWKYSNSNYMIAGLIVEKVSGLSLSEFLQRNIFNPLGMTHTCVGNYDRIIKNAVNGYDRALEKDNFKPAIYMGWIYTFGHGNITSNLHDLLKWDNALYTDKIIKSEWLKKAWTPFELTDGRIAHYGFGWSINNFHGIKLIEHDGGINGFSSDGIRVPSKKLYIVILSNKPSTDQDRIAQSITVRLAGLKLTLPSHKSFNKNINEYSGVYALHADGLKNVGDSIDKTQYRYFTSKHDTLFTQTTGIIRDTVFFASKDLFIHKNGHLLYQFHRNTEDKIVSVEIYYELIQYGINEVNFKTALSLQLPEEKHAIILNINQLNLLTGKYDFGGGLVLPVTTDGTKIYFQLPGKDKEEMFAKDELNFFFKTSDATIEFVGDKGKIKSMIAKLGGEIHEAKKIDE